MRTLVAMVACLLLFAAFATAAPAYYGELYVTNLIVRDAIEGVHGVWDIDAEGTASFDSLVVDGDYTVVGDTNFVLTGYLDCDSSHVHKLVVDSTVAFTGTIDFTGGTLVDLTVDSTLTADSTRTRSLVATTVYGSNAETLSNATNGYWQSTGALLAPSYNFATAGMVTGTGDAILVDFTPNFPALAAGDMIMFIAEAANTGAATIAIDGGAAKNIYEDHDVSALEANDIRSGMVVVLVYDGTEWIQISPSGN